MKNENYNVLLVSSRLDSQLELESEKMNFFLLKGENERVKNVEEVARVFNTSFSQLNFLNRLIPTMEGDKRISDTLPKNDKIDGIITDLWLLRDKHSLELEMHGLGIVAWAVQHSIPVGLIMEEYEHHPKNISRPFVPYKTMDEDFYIDSLIDTLQSDSRCVGNKIPISSNCINVCRDMHFLLYQTKK